MSIWLDLTTVKKWNRPAVGIVRVETELLRFFLNNQEWKNVKYCTYDKSDFSFNTVEFSEAKEWLHRIDNYGKNQNCDSYKQSQKPLYSLIRQFVRRTNRYLFKGLPEEVKTPLLSYLAQQYDGCTYSLKRKLKSITHSLSTKKDIASKSESITFLPNDIYISVGLDWEYKNMQQLYILKRDFKVKNIFMCYDLIPYLRPHLCVTDVAAFFAKYFSDLAWAAHHVLCISNNSKIDFLNFLDQLNIPHPITSVITLGSDLKKPDFDKINPDIKNLAKDKYILFVSTIERRKNHEVIYRAMTRLVDKGYKNLPKVIFVGMQGWGVAELMTDIKLDHRVHNLFTILNHVNDDELSYLYLNCYFSVYPSLYEGWGLPVGESLSFGKPCIASNTSSLPEVGTEFVEYLDPWNVSEWEEKIREYLDNPELVNRRSEHIKKYYTAPKWTETVNDVLQQIL